MYNFLLTHIPSYFAIGEACEAKEKAASFFGITPWYQYLGGERDAFGTCVPTVKGLNDFWLIGLAITDALLKVAGLVAVGFVIYGGIQFILSSGEPDKTKKARDTLLNAVIGLVIAIIASALVSFIGNRIT